MGKFAGFSQVKLDKPSRSTFDLGHQKRMSTRMGRLTPVLITECVPSDSFRGGSEILLRLAPLLAPIYDQIQLFVHFFFVPNRLLWDDWEKFITGGRLGVGVDPAVAPVPPFYDMENIFPLVGPSSIADYLGVPDYTATDPTPTNWTGRTIDAMPFFAYHLIWYEYYRDRNFVADFATDAETYPRPSGIAITDAMETRTRSYLHDYFTSSLPFTQRGEEVLMPLAGTGSVTYLDTSLVREASGGNPAANTLIGTTGLIVGEMAVGKTGATASGTTGRIENIDEVIFDGSSVSINDFRSAYALQVWLERNAIGGSRYTESTQAHFGVKPQDSRLQRPEYIGGGRINVQISEVVASNWSNDGTADVPQANMAGHGITYGNTNRFNYYCTEHGFIIGLASIMNPPSYQQGLPRMFKRRSFLDYPWPTFAKLGEQPVNDFEIYCDPASMSEDVDGEFPLFGYQSRYADWKYMCTTNHGDFRTTLLFWTLTRIFDSPPVLSSTFNEFQDNTQDRIFAIGGPTVDNFWLYVNNSITVKRPLPYFGTPNTLGFS